MLKVLLRYAKLLSLLFSTVIFLNCKKAEISNLIEVAKFNPIANFKSAGDTLNLTFNLDDAIKDGIKLPNTNKSFFLIKFKVKNNDTIAKQLYYKTFYQNESYKFKELDEDGEYNVEADNNFYGSWINGNTGFRSTKLIPADGKYHEIIDSIKIVGNPRNEKRYFGGKPQNDFISANEIKKTVDRIKSVPAWLEKVKQKAIKNNLTLSDQLKKDAKWIITQERSKGDHNNRWKRNPRVGTYSFMLVVTDNKGLKKVPAYYQDVTVKDPKMDAYRNPFAYYLNENLPAQNPFLQVLKSSKAIKAKMKLDFSKGIYINPNKFDENITLEDTNKLVGFSDNLFYNAHVQQFVHHINRNFTLKNIPIAYDVVNGNYTQSQYLENSKKYNDSLLTQFVNVSNAPGKTVQLNKENKAVSITNPGFESDSVLKKEHVGIQTRHGLTYGKFRAKIQFPKMISEDYVWNGLTCAFWLIYQEGKWNSRDTCNSGYIPKGNKREGRTLTNSYSEIDIEIVKTSKYWTQSSYGGREDYPKDAALNNNVMVTCTNWDLACSDPANFNQGVRPKIFGKDTFQLHRWDKYYKALTSKFEYPQELTLGQPFYYEIEWKPNEIIWRLGPNKNNMRVIGYMDNTNTKIPSNQMVMVVTQEFHDASWWPTAPFDQNKVPFPLKDISGYIYEMEVE